MSDDLHSLFREYLATLGVGAADVKVRIQRGEMTVDSLDKDFFRYRLEKRRGMADFTIFESDDFERLRQLVLSAPPDISYDEYWSRTSAATAGLIVEELGLTPASLALDFGCGVGRLARAVLARVPCRLVGVDLSLNMLEASVHHVGNPAFRPLSAADFHADPVAAGPFTAAYASLVLQHCLDPRAELEAIRAACVTGARILVINASRRFLPTSTGWFDDRIDVRALIQEMFTVEKEIALAEIAELRFDPSAPPTADEAGHYALVARVR